MADPSTPGLKIAGRVGKHSLVNGTYAPMADHNGKFCWCAQGVSPVYIFHTGKARWVISKRIDDGSKCYAFIKDAKLKSGETAKTPAQCSGNGRDEDDEDWVICDDDGEWRPDTKLACLETMASNDPFVKLRMSVEDEMTKYGLTTVDKLKSLWKSLDYNGNAVVSLAEIDKLVVEMTKAGTWPEWLNNKPALMRAYKKTILVDGDGDDWVEKKEFHALLLNLFWFGKLWAVFDAIDTGDDRRIDVNEFQAGLSKVGLDLSPDDAAKEFAKIDMNGGGQVLFVEFCAYVRKRVNPDANPAFDGDVVSGTKCSVHMRKSLGDKATHTTTITRKSFSHFDELEKQVKETMKDKKKLKDLWKCIDFNGNNIVSLAEIDKMVVEKYPLLNHKPALMRAYKFTIKKGDGDDWVDKKEFKMLLGALFYFNKIFWLFDNVDGDKDRRLNLAEFKEVMAKANKGSTMSEKDLEEEFKKIDKNGGGIVLFDEFCAYFTSKSCPDCMAELVD